MSVSMTYGNVKVRPEDVAFLMTLRQSSWDAVREIGVGQANG